jgi:hypothetical protein
VDCDKAIRDSEVYDRSPIMRGPLLVRIKEATTTFIMIVALAVTFEVLALLLLYGFVRSIIELDLFGLAFVVVIAFLVFYPIFFSKNFMR